MEPLTHIFKHTFILSSMFSNSFNFTVNCIHEDIQQVSCWFVFITKNSLLIPEHIAETISSRVSRDKCMYCMSDIYLLQCKLTWLKRWGNGAPVSNEQFH